MRQVINKEKSDWAKLRLKNAEYAHITKESITVSFKKYDKNMVYTEWAEKYPNDSTMIQTCLKIGDKSVYISGSLVGLIKKFGRITSYPNCMVTDGFEALGVTKQEVSIEFSDHKTYLYESNYYKDGKAISLGSTISIVD